MTAKEKAISAAYGEAWEKVKEYVDENGWCEYMVYPYDLGFNEANAEKDLIGDTVRWRPKYLRAIDENNGWTRCDERLPKKLGDYYVCINGEFDGQIMHTNEIKIMFERFPDHSKPSHWQPVVLPKPPIY